MAGTLRLSWALCSPLEGNMKRTGLSKVGRDPSEGGSPLSHVRYTAGEGRMLNGVCCTRKRGLMALPKVLVGFKGHVLEA